MDDIKKTEQGHEVSIALIQKDISYIRDSITKIDTTMALYDRNFARKDEMKEIEKIIENIHKEIKEALSTKVNRSEFDPIKKILTRINWLLIVAVVGGLLTLLIKAGS